MKILYVYDKLYPAYQTYLFGTLDALKIAATIKVLLYDNNNAADYSITHSKFKKKWHRLLNKLGVTAHKRLDLKIMNTYDVVHLQHSYLFKKIIPLLESQNRPKIVITLRGSDTYVKPWLYTKRAEFYKQYGSKVDAFVTMSEHQKDYLHTKWSVPKDRIHVIPISYGVKFDINPKYPNKDTMKVISAFRMCWEKNIDGNLRTIKLLKEKGCPVQYDVYGDGTDTGQLLYLIDQYNLSDCVTYHGRISNSKLKSILSKYDFFLQLSHSESLGMSVIEAQAHGVPAVVSNAGGLPEIVEFGKTGFVINTDETEKAAQLMIDLWQSEEKYYRFSQDAIAKTQNTFNVQEEVEKLKKLYSTLIEK